MSATTPLNNDYKAPYSRDDSTTTMTEGTPARGVETTMMSTASDSVVPISTALLQRTNSRSDATTSGSISNERFWDSIADLVPTDKLVRSLQHRQHDRHSSLQLPPAPKPNQNTPPKVTVDDSAKVNQQTGKLTASNNTQTTPPVANQQVMALIAQLELLKIKEPKRRYTVQGPSPQSDARTRAATVATTSTTNATSAVHLTPGILQQARDRQKEVKELVTATRQYINLAAQQAQITTYLKQCDLIQLYNCLLQNRSITVANLPAGEQELLQGMREWMTTERDPQVARLLLQVAQEIIMELRKNNLPKLCQLLRDHSEALQLQGLNRLIKSAISEQKQKQLDAVIEWLKIPTDPKELVTLDRLIRQQGKLNFDKLATKDFGPDGEIIVAHALLDGQEIIQRFLTEAQFNSLIPERAYRIALLLEQGKKERLVAHNARQSAAEQKENKNTHVVPREKLTLINSIASELKTHFPKDALKIVEKLKASAFDSLIGDEGRKQLVQALKTQLAIRYHTLAPTKTKKKKIQLKKANTLKKPVTQ